MIFAIIAHHAVADGEADNHPENVRRIPKLGIELGDAQRELLRGRLSMLTSAIESLRTRRDSRIAMLLPDVEVMHKAVHDGMTYREFFDAKEADAAIALIDLGMARAEQLSKGLSPWVDQPGLTVRGYVSRIDGSIQPYGLVIPPSYTGPESPPHRLDIWFHGRGETLSELNFIHQRLRSPGDFTPPNTIVLHPYGRYCNANKFAGEIDVLEALEAVKRDYRIDPDRISVRGFSMGGAACWQFAVHYADQWFAANPGAGFSETPRFLDVFQKQKLNPTWWEKKLWHWYDCNDWARNLHHCPTVAYSGENDIQKQAADVMAEALAAEGVDLIHIIGPDTGHKYHPDSAAEVERRMASLAEAGRTRVPHELHFVTWTLRYNRMKWITVEGLGEHWSKATVDGRLQPGRRGIELTTSNVTDLTINLKPGESPFALGGPVTITIDGQRIELAKLPSDQSLHVSLHREGGTWKVGERPGDGLRKRPGLQGPIDDAFLDSFIFVKPTGKGRHEKIDRWVNAELDRAIEHWRRHFRGQARVKADTEITDADIASANLVLWGDAASNGVLKRIADRLPIGLGESQIVAGKRQFAADHHAPILIYPNPLNPARYVVVNSSFTFREFAYLNNARQVAMLPDWAVVDVNTPAGTEWPGKVVDAGFFDESWRMANRDEPQDR